MSRVVGLLGAGLWMAVGLTSPAAGAEPPAVKLVSAPLVSPTQAWVGSTARTEGVATWGAQTPPEIAALARTLSVCRDPATGHSTPCSPDQYAQNVFDYVHNNIAVEYRFGLGKGARGALIDQSGTPFDQAELMVKVLRAGNVSAAFQTGAITLTARQFGQWTGLVKSLDDEAQTFSVDARAACRLLADGGIPATFDAPDCAAVGGDLANVTFSHVWVVVNGKAYDPSFKRHVLRAGRDLAADMQCGDCVGYAVTAAMTGAATGSLAGAPYIQHVNESQLGLVLNEKAVALQNSIQASHRFADLETIVGGKTLDPTVDYSAEAAPSYADQASWAGDVPDAYRTTLEVQLGNVHQTFFADELAGRRLRMQSATALYVDSTPISAPACPNCVVDTAILDIKHPYGANGGLYGDDHAELRLVALKNGMVVPGSYPMTIVHGWGAASSSTEQQVAGLQEVDPLGADNMVADAACGGAWENTTSGFLCRNDSQPLVAAKFLAQGAAVDRMVSGVGDAMILRHHDVGVAYGQPDGPGSSSYVSVQSSLSVIAVDDTKRIAAYETSAAMWGMLEGAVNQQLDDSSRAESAAALFSVFNGPQQRKFLSVASANMAAVLAATATGYNGNAQLQAAADAGYDAIMVDFGRAELFYKTDARAYTMYETVKGGGTGDVDPTRSVLESTKQATQAAPRQKYLSVSAADGALRLAPSPDIVTGQGEFPRSLSFQRIYSSDGGGSERFDKSVSYTENTSADTSSDSASIAWRYGGPDMASYARLGGGWNHNLNVTATYSNNGLKALGSDTALDAASVIAGVLTLNSLLSSPTFEKRLTSIFVANWISGRLSYNSVLIDKGGAVEAFQRLPDGSFNPSGGSPARLVQTGERTFNNDYRPVALSYTGKAGDVIQFDVGFLPLVPVVAGVDLTRGGPIFKANSWSFPDGVRVTFNYLRKRLELTKIEAPLIHLEGQAPFADILQSVTNNLGRSLSFTTQPIGFDGEPTPFAYRITRVTDDAGRFVDYALADCVGGAKLACNTMTVTQTDQTVAPAVQAVTKYSYAADAASPDPTQLTKSTYRLRRWYSPSNQNVPYQVARYDELFRVMTVTGIGVDGVADRQIEYFPGAVAGTELWKRGGVVAPTKAIAISVFEQKNNLTALTDPLGRTTKQAYDSIGRLVSTINPEGDSATQIYDVRSNLLSKTRHAKPSSGLPPITTSAAYVEGASVFNCAAQIICNKFYDETDGRGSVTNYEWDYDQSTHTGTGQLKKLLRPPSADQLRPQTDFGYTLFAGVGGGNLSLLTSKIERISSDRSVTTNYDYVAENKYVLKSATVDQGGLSLRTCFYFDPVGNLVRTIDPRGGSACP